MSDKAAQNNYGMLSRPMISPTDGAAADEPEEVPPEPMPRSRSIVLGVTTVVNPATDEDGYLAPPSRQSGKRVQTLEDSQKGECLIQF